MQTTDPYITSLKAEIKSLREQVTRLAARESELEQQLEDICSYAGTTRIRNTVDWMHHLVVRLNKACEVLNDPSRFMLERDEYIRLVPLPEQPHEQP